LGYSTIYFDITGGMRSLFENDTVQKNSGAWKELFSISTRRVNGISSLLGAGLLYLFKLWRCLLIVVFKGTINLLPLSHTLLVHVRYMVLGKPTPTMTMITYMSGQLEELQGESPL
jgi:hypothetical protein